MPFSGPPLLLNVRNSFPCRSQSAAGSRWRAEGAGRRHRQRHRSWCQPDEVRTAERQQVWKLRTLHGQETPRTRSSECQQECSGVSVETADGGREDQRSADVEEKCCPRSRFVAANWLVAEQVRTLLRGANAGGRRRNGFLTTDAARRRCRSSSCRPVADENPGLLTVSDIPSVC